MASAQITVVDGQLQGIKLERPDAAELIHKAKESDAIDRLLTVRQALKKYKVAMFWAMFLSLALVMEGFDGNMVCTEPGTAPCCVVFSKTHKAIFPFLDEFVLRPDAVPSTLRHV